MIDIHSHVLYGVDDGADTVDHSVDMLEMALANGTTEIVASPHANTEFNYLSEVVEQRVSELNQLMGGRIRIYSGCDFHLKFDNVNDALENPNKYTIDHKRYLLVELSDMVIFKSTEPDFQRLQQAGMLLVITHPERNPLLQQRMEQLRDWIEMGCYLQVTAGSLFGRFGRRANAFAEELMKRNMVHFLASDAHDCNHRPPILTEAYKLVSKKYGDKRAMQLMVEHPRLALQGEPLPVASAPVPEEAPKRWRTLWR